MYFRASTKTLFVDNKPKPYHVIPVLLLEFNQSSFLVKSASPALFSLLTPGHQPSLRYTECLEPVIQKQSLLFTEHKLSNQSLIADILRTGFEPARAINPYIPYWELPSNRVYLESDGPFYDMPRSTLKANVPRVYPLQAPNAMVYIHIHKSFQDFRTSSELG